MSAAKKNSVPPDLSALLGGASGASADTTAQQETHSRSVKKGSIRTTVALSEDQRDSLRILAWFERRQITDIYAEVFQTYLASVQDKIDHASREYDAAGRPNLESRRGKS